MNRWHGYVGIEDLGLTDAQRGVLLAALQKLGPVSDPQPARRMQVRVSVERTKAILEAAFDEDNLTVAAFVARMAELFGVAGNKIATETEWVTLAERETPVVTFKRGRRAYVRFVLFGGRGATWEQSRRETLAYLAAYRDEWEPPLEEPESSRVEAGFGARARSVASDTWTRVAGWASDAVRRVSGA